MATFHKVANFNYCVGITIYPVKREQYKCVEMSVSGSELELPISYMTCSHTSACLCVQFEYVPQQNFKSKHVMGYQGHLQTVKTTYIKSINAKGPQYKCKLLINFMKDV